MYPDRVALIIVKNFPASASHAPVEGGRLMLRWCLQLADISRGVRCRELAATQVPVNTE